MLQVSPSSCRDDWSLCDPVKSWCYPSHSRCHYVTYKGIPLYCPELEHLYHCDDYQCPHMYKCKGTYCIPTRMVCDGIMDCPDGQEEELCSNAVCPGLLRCRHDDICVHPTDICDGVIHCLASADDEKLCDMVQCPDGCICHGSAVKCTDVLPDFTKSLKYLKAIILEKLYIPNGYTLRQPANLFYLNINECVFYYGMIDTALFRNHNNIQTLLLRSNNIQAIKQNTFVNMANVLIIDIRENQINVLQSFAFNGMRSFHSLDLSRMYITTIIPTTFTGLAELNNLNLSANLLTAIMKNTFIGLTDVQMIDLRYNPIVFIDTHAFYLIDDAIRVYFSRPVYCCYISGNQHCYVNETENRKHVMCTNIIGDTNMKTINIILSLIAIIIHLLNFVLLRNFVENYQSQLLLQHLSIVDSFPAFYMLLLCAMSLIYENNFIYLTTQWLTSYTCRCLNTIVMAGFFLSRFTILVIVINHLLVTKFIFKKRPLSTKQILGYLSLAWAIVIMMSIVETMYNRISHITCFPFFSSRNDTYLHWMDIYILLFVTLCMILSVKYMYWNIFHYVQQSSKSLEKTNMKFRKSLVCNIILVVVMESLSWTAMATNLICQYIMSSSPHLLIMMSIAIHVQSLLHPLYYIKIYYNKAKRR